MRIHHTELSEANGPGKRYVIWVQGCTLNCPGCYNSSTHDLNGGYDVDPVVLVRNATKFGADGITVSGGEPFQQPEDLIRVCCAARIEGLSVVIFTGYTLEELDEICHPLQPEDNWREWLPADVVIAGRYVAQRRLATGLIGSSNKEMIFLSNCYKREDFEKIPVAEVIITGDHMTTTGIDPLYMKE